MATVCCCSIYDKRIGKIMKIKTKSVKFNMIMNTLLTLSSMIFPLITFPYISRILLPAGTGKVSFAISIMTYFLMFAELGIPTYGIRACAKIRDDKEELTKIVQEILLINLIMCVLVYVLYFIAIFNVPRLKSDKMLFFIVGGNILLNAMGVEWLYKGLEQYSYITIRSIVFKFISLVLMFVFVHKQEDYRIYAGITIFASSASNILNFVNLRKIINLKLSKNLNLWRHMKMITTFFAMAIATTIYTNLDTVMVGFMKGDDEVGYYNAAVKIKTILVSVVTSISTVLLPRVSLYVEKGMMDDFKKIIKKTIDFCMVISIPMFIYFIFFAKEGIYFLSGEKFHGAILPMQIIMPTLLFIGLTNILGIQILVPINQEIQVLYSEIVGAVVDLILNFLLIPKYGATGAAIGTVVAEAVVLLWQYIALRRLGYRMFQGVHVIPILISVIISAAGSLWVKQLGLHAFLTLVMSSICFFVIYIVLLLIFKEPTILELRNDLIKKRSK